MNRSTLEEHERRWREYASQQAFVVHVRHTNGNHRTFTVWNKRDAEEMVWYLRPNRTVTSVWYTN